MESQHGHSGNPEMIRCRKTKISTSTNHNKRKRRSDSIDLSRIPTNNSAESRSGWTKIQQMYENVHPNLALVLLFERTEVECGKGLLKLEAKNALEVKREKECNPYKEE